MHKPFYLNIRSNKKLLIYSLVFAIFAFGNSLVSSIFPLYLKTFSNSLILIGMVGSVGAILASFISILVGNAVDKYGSKNFILIGLFATSFLYTAYYFSPLLSLVVLIQILVAFSRELVYTPFYSMIRDSAKPEKAIRGFSMIQAISTAAYIIGPIVAGYVALTSFRAPFLIAALAVMVSYVVLFYTKTPKHSIRKNALIGIECFRTAFKDFKKLGVEGKHLAFSILTLNTWYAAKWFIGPLLLFYLGFSTVDIGLWLSISLIPFLVLSLPLASFVDGGRKNKTMIILWGMMFSLIPLMFLGFAQGLWLYFFIIAIAIGNVLSDMLMDARITEMTPPNEYGEITGVIESTKNVGGIIGPLITTLFAQLFGIQYSLIPIVAMFMVSIYLLSKNLKMKGQVSL